MFSSKIRLLIGLLIFGAGIFFICICSHPPQPAKPLEMLLQKSDSRLERAERDGRLQAEADALLPFFDRMPPVPIYVKDEPILKSGTDTETANAYTHCDGNEAPLIFVKKTYYETAHQTRLTNTLKHEMTHAWLCRQRLMSSGHGELFRQKLKQIGGWLSRTRPEETNRRQSR